MTAKDHQIRPQPFDRAAQIVAVAEKWLGTPYHHQASHCQVGADCLGLIRGIYADIFGISPDVPPYSRRHRAAGDDVLQRALAHFLMPLNPSDMQQGDVLLFALRAHLCPQHLAIYDGAQMIHAVENHAVMRVDFEPRWRRLLAGVYRFPAHPVAEILCLT